MEDGVSHLFPGGSVPGDGGSSLQIPGAASREVGTLCFMSVCLTNRIIRFKLYKLKSVYFTWYMPKSTLSDFIV